MSYPPQHFPLILPLLTVVAGLLVIQLIVIAVFGYFVCPHLSEVKTAGYWYGGGEIPIFTVSAVYLVDWLYENLRGRWRWVSGGLTLIWFFGILSSARGFVSQVDYRGIIGQLDRFNADLASHSVLIFGDAAPVGAGDTLGTPLRFLFEVSVLENTYDHKPTTLSRVEWQIPLAEVRDGK